MLTVLFFASLREELGCDRESLALPVDVTTVAGLRDELGRRGEHWQQALNRAGLLVAVEQTLADWDAPLQGHEEVAFFPPVTGG